RMHYSRQHRQVIGARTVRAQLCVVAALHDDVGLDWPSFLVLGRPGERGPTRRAQVAALGDGLPTLPTVLLDRAQLGHGADGYRVPSLGRVLDSRTRLVPLMIDILVLVQVLPNIARGDKHQM